MDDAKLIERLRSSAKAFRENPIYTMDGDPVILTVQADELEKAADRLSTLSTDREAIRREAFKEAAKVAAGIAEQRSRVLMTDDDDFDDGVEVALRIATAIRTLAQSGDAP